MASLTQMVVGKGIPNPLIAEDLLKNLRDHPTYSHQNSLPILFHGTVGPQIVFFFPAKRLQIYPVILTLYL